MTDIAAPAIEARPDRLFSPFERWPSWFFYAPAFVSWFVYSARYGGLTLPTIANTHPALSGFLCESKSESFELLGPKGRAHLPPYVAITTDSRANPQQGERNAARAMAEAGLAFPVMAKPDIGQNGAGVRQISDADSLCAYLHDFPAGERLILQKYIADEGEAGVFYVREPGAARGRIVSLTLKFLPKVTGDGISTLRELILADPRARRIAKLYFVRHKSHLDMVVPKDEQMRLVSVGNHCRGAIFRNGANHITQEMEDVFDAIAQEIEGFHFGRFDVRFKTISDLERGERFTILEVNGADSEMTHIWDADETIAGAYATLFEQYRLAFAIGAANRARGAKPAGHAQFIRAWLKNRALLSRYALEE